MSYWAWCSVNKDDVDPLEAIIEQVKSQRGIKLDYELNVEELQQLVKLFKEAIKKRQALTSHLTL